MANMAETYKLLDNSRYRESPAERYKRFLAEPDENGCVLWTGAKSSGGYGNFGARFDGKIQIVRAHRFGWELHYGTPPDGHVLHKCDRRLCQAIDHLFLGDHALNMADKVAKGRHSHGENHGQSLLTEEQVRQIMALVRAGRSQRSLAAEFGISKSTISAIVRRRIWRHLDL